MVDLTKKNEENSENYNLQTPDFIKAWLNENEPADANASLSSPWERVNDLVKKMNYDRKKLLSALEEIFCDEEYKDDASCQACLIKLILLKIQDRDPPYNQHTPDYISDWINTWKNDFSENDGNLSLYAAALQLVAEPSGDDFYLLSNLFTLFNHNENFVAIKEQLRQSMINKNFEDPNPIEPDKNEVAKDIDALDDETPDYQSLPDVSDFAKKVTNILEKHDPIQLQNLAPSIPIPSGNQNANNINGELVTNHVPTKQLEQWEELIDCLREFLVPTIKLARDDINSETKKECKINLLYGLSTLSYIVETELAKKQTPLNCDSQEYHDVQKMKDDFHAAIQNTKEIIDSDKALRFCAAEADFTFDTGHMVCTVLSNKTETEKFVVGQKYYRKHFDQSNDKVGTGKTTKPMDPIEAELKRKNRNLGLGLLAGAALIGGATTLTASLGLLAIGLGVVVAATATVFVGGMLINSLVNVGIFRDKRSPAEKMKEDAKAFVGAAVDYTEQEVRKLPSPIECN